MTKFRTRLSFLLAAAVLISFLVTATFAFRLAAETQSLTSKLEEEIGKAIQELRHSGASSEEPLGASILSASRELAKIKALEADRVISRFRGAFVFFGFQSFLLFVALAIVAVFVTKGLASLSAGIEKLRGGDREFRFSAKGAREFVELAAELNRALNLIETQEARLRDAAALSGWKEVASFLSHQLKNPIASIDLAARNAKLALENAKTDDSHISSSGQGNERTPEQSSGVSFVLQGMDCMRVHTPKAIKSAAELRGMDPPANQESFDRLVLENLDLIVEEGRRMNALVRRLNDLTAFGNPKIKETSLERIIFKAAERFGKVRGESPECESGALAEGRTGEAGDRAAIRADIPRNATIDADEDILVQAFVNLFNNSVEAWEERAAEFGGKAPLVEIFVRAKEGTERIQVTVSDSNRGVPSEVAAKLGEVRYTNKRTGSGLGLLLVKRIVHIHNGTFAVESSEEGGLVFRLSFPLGGKS